MQEIPGFIRESAVPAENVEDYLRRYYKPERYQGRKSLLIAYQQEFERNGYCSTSLHDNVMGRFISYIGKGGG